MSSEEDALENMSSTQEMEESYFSTCFDSDDEDLEYQGRSGYMCEPEYIKEELEKRGIKALESDDETVSSDDSGNDFDSSRLGNLHWCTCGHCCIMPMESGIYIFKCHWTINKELQVSWAEN